MTHLMLSSETRRKDVQDARQKADEIDEGGTCLGRILSMEALGGPLRMPQADSAIPTAGRTGGGPLFEPGKVSAAADVTLTFTFED